MNESLMNSAKEIGEHILNLSEDRSSTMKSWAVQDKRPNGLTVTECVGFTANDDEPLQIVTDLIIAETDDTATLRLWAIKSEFDDQQTERFNNIQLDFTVIGETARHIANKGEAATRSDLRSLLLTETTVLKRLIVSDMSGMNQDTNEQLGVRFDIDKDSTGIDAAQVELALHTVIARLQ